MHGKDDYHILILMAQSNEMKVINLAFHFYRSRRWVIKFVRSLSSFVVL